MSLIRDRDFVKLWIGESVSVLGTQVTALAIPLIAIQTLHATTFEVGLLTAVEISPFLLVSLHAGVIVDRRRRRPVLISTDVGRAAALLTIPLAYAFDILTLGQLFVVVFVTGILTVFFDVAYQSYLPALVERDQIAEGNGKLQISESGAQIAGPGLAGQLIGWLGAPAAMLVDACSFLVSGIAVLLIRKPEPDPEPSPAAGEGERGAGMRAEIREGVSYVFGNRYLRNIAACTSSGNLFSSITQAVFIVYMVRELGFSAGTIGLIFAVGNIGFLASAALCTRITRTIGLGPALVGGIALGIIGAFAFPLAPQDGAVPWIIGGWVLVAFGIPIYNINQVSFRQAITPHRLQGRMNATMRFLVWGTMPIGALGGGAIGSVFGVRTALWVAAAGGSVAILPLVLSPVRSLREIPPMVDDQPPDEPERIPEVSAPT